MIASRRRARTRLLVDVSWVSAARYLSEALYLLRGVLLARVLGPEVFGIWSSMRLVRRFGQYSSLGSIHGMLQLAPPAAGRGDEAAAARYRRAASSVTFATALALALGVAAVAWLRSDAATGDTLGLWLLFAAVLVASQLHRLQLAVLRSRQRFGLLGALTLGVAASTTLVGVAAAWGFGLAGFLLTLGVAHVAVLLLPLPVTRVPSPSSDLATARRLVGTGSSILTAQLLQGLVANLDKLLLWLMVGSTALGLYALPTYLVSAALLIPQGVVTVAYPRLLETLGRTASPQAAWPYLERASAVLGQLACPVLGLLCLTLHLPLEWWLPEYVPGIAPGRVLLLVAFFPILSALPATVLISLGAQRSLIVLRSVAVAVSALLVAATLAGGGGLRAVALATAPGAALLSISTLLVALRWAGLPWSRAVRVLLWALSGYGLLLAGVAALGEPVSVPVGDWSGALRQVLAPALGVSGILAIWAAWSAHRLGMIGWRGNG